MEEAESIKVYPGCPTNCKMLISDQ